MPWRIELFGGPRAVRVGDGGVVDRFRVQRAGLLLAYLAAEPGRARSREELGELLWPEKDPRWQRDQLRYVLTVLRNATDASLIHTSGNTLVSLAPGVRSDGADFEDCLRSAARAAAAASGAPQAALPYLEAAVALYRGELLPGFYDEWTLRERDRLHERFGDALIQLYRHLDRAGSQEAARHRRREAEERFPDRDLPPLARSVRPPLGAPVHARHAAPAPLFGREAELREVRTWLEAEGGGAAPLLTITGLGGVGKTRLAAEALRAEAPGVVALPVPLAAVTDSPRLFEALAGALTEAGMCDAAAAGAAGAAPPEGGGSAREECVARLRALDRPPVLLLDNCEQIAGAGAALADLLASCPGLRFLATSRSPLGTPGERQLALPPLPDADALALFLDRARAARPDFGAGGTGGDTVAALGDLCRQLDGVPLAIELAAGRAAGLGAAEIRSQLADRLRFLRSDASETIADAPAPEGRHSSIRAALEWSVALLPAGLRHTFALLSVFADGFPLDAAAAVRGEGAAETAEALESLRRHSLLGVSFAGEQTAGAAEYETARWRLLPLVREFAGTLLDGPEREAARRRHAEYYAAQAERVRARLARGEWAAAGRWLRRESPELRAAALFAAEAAATGEAGLLHQLADSLANPLFEAGLWEDCAELLARAEAASATAADTPEGWGRLARTLSLRGALARRRGREEEARQLWARALALHLVHDAPEAAIDLLADLAGQALDRGRIEEAAGYVERIGGLARRREERLVEGVLRARLAQAEGDRRGALAHADAVSVLLGAQVPAPDYLLYALTYLAPVFRAAGKPERAEQALQHALAVAHADQLPFHIARLSAELGSLYEERADWTGAAVGYYVAREVHAELGSQRAAQSAACWMLFRQRMRLREDVILFLEELQSLSWEAAIPILRREVGR